MNRIAIQKICKGDNWIDFEWFIDGVRLSEYVSEQVGEPLVELTKSNNICDYVEIYCRTIELMWRYGDEAVKNVVDVTLLERLSDDEAVWRSFGRCISDDFKKYINEELLKGNIAMFLVGKIE